MSIGIPSPKIVPTVPSQLGVAQIVFDLVRPLLAPGIDVNLSLDSSLDGLGLDSLARMGVVNRLEETFRIRVPEEQLYDLETCGDLVKCIEPLLAMSALSASGLKASSASQPAAVPAAKPAAKLTPVSTERAVPPEDYDVTKFPECVAFQQRLADATAVGLEVPFFRVKQRTAGSTTVVNGQEVVSYTSFDYLGLAAAPQVIAAARQAIDEFGLSASASRLVGGNNTIIANLDEAIARFLGTEAAIVFPSGYGTNASLLGHLFGADDLIVYDELAHNSIVQGAMLSKAQRRPFPHNDFAFLDRLLSDVRSQHRRVVVAIEGVYSMDGDYPDLPKFLEVKERHKALLYVDEAHSLGVLGKTGRGICEHFHVDPNAGDLWMGTISKALGSSGGYLAGRALLIQYLKYTTPAIVFSTASPPVSSAAALAAIQCIQQEPERIRRLQDRSALFLKLAQERSLNTGGSRNTPVIPIILGGSSRSMWVSQELLRRGIDAQPILYPAVPESGARLRFFITANHTERQIRQTVETLTECVAASEKIGF